MELSGSEVESVDILAVLPAALALKFVSEHPVIIKADTAIINKRMRAPSLT
jgi:hypothetical protein